MLICLSAYKHESEYYTYTVQEGPGSVATTNRANAQETLVSRRCTTLNRVWVERHSWRVDGFGLHRTITVLRLRISPVTFRPRE